MSSTIADFSIGLMDGLTTPASLLAGLMATGASRDVVVKAILAEAVAGCVSMGLANYLSVDGTERKEKAWK
jgi:VIT1/CCC1 family predicted Fe2+/Mn2+ transporter